MTPITLRLNFSLVGVPISSLQDLQPLLAVDDQTYFTASVSLLFMMLGLKEDPKAGCLLGKIYIRRVINSMFRYQHDGPLKRVQGLQGRGQTPSWSQRTGRFQAMWLVNK